MLEIRTGSESEAWLLGFPGMARVHAGERVEVASKLHVKVDVRVTRDESGVLSATVKEVERVEPKPPEPDPAAVTTTLPGEVQTPAQLVDEHLAAAPGAKFRRVSSLPKRIHRAALSRKVAALAKDIGRTFARQNKEFAELAKRKKKPAGRRGRR